MIPAAPPPPAIVAAAPILLPFAPPPMTRYRTVQTRASSAGPQHFTMERTLAFARRPGGGWRATLTLTAASSDAPDPVRTSFQAGMAPFVGVPIVVDLDRAGRIVAVIEGDRMWAQVAASYRAVLASMEARGTPPAALARFRALLATMTDVPPAVQEAKAREAIEPFLARDMPPLRPGETVPYSADRASPLGVRLRVAGTAALAAADGAHATYRFELAEDPTALAAAVRAAGATAATPGLRQAVTATVDRVDGLLLRQRTETTLVVAGRTIALSEETLRLP